MLSAEGSINPHVHTIYAPDSSGRLAASTELVNDDVPWLSGPAYASIRVGCRLIHPNISSLVAEKLGVKSLRLTLVNQNAEQNLFGNSQSSAVEAFGQAESLTSRLKTILDLYPEGNPIFSELIQNADDAGASTVYIMLDENSYPTESLLDSKMAPLQGPSLIFANDAMFTEADYRSK
jgi:sacsin